MRKTNPSALSKNILIVEDEAVFAKAMKKQLQRAHYHCDIAMDIATAKQKLEAQLPDLVLLDMRLPDGSGLDLLEAINRDDDTSALIVIVMSAYGEIEDAVSAMKIGASDYLKKPIDLQELLLNIERVLSKDELEAKLAYSSKRERNASEVLTFIGDCPQIQSIKQQIKQISQLNHTSENALPTILILGETGTGKDVIAKALHASSAVSDKPFVQIDCASLPGNVIEAELFGHERGAFTDAHAARIGLIEAAEGGALFMDEIGELPINLQPKLMAVLERRLIRRVGATRELPVRAWFIAATNRQLQDQIRSGTFRSDLYYRLNVFNITVPPLRERGQDIIVLAKHFIEQTARCYGFNNISLNSAAQAAIMAYPWPGNVREMKHLIERAVLLSNGGELSVEQLGLANWEISKRSSNLSAHPTNVTEDADENTLKSTEIALIKQALAKTNGNVSQAARDLGITRMVLRYRMKKYGING